MNYSEDLLLLSKSSINPIDAVEDKTEKNITVKRARQNNVIRSKKIHKLETNLMSALLDSVDSDSRKRHVKRLIYGENVNLKH
tara:strand:- start:300 stop:548 length:249 start_codon:yes stop_codon:yes gene_type:complete